jgi:membrane protease YdiL (CAAX protease family)
LLFVAAMLPGYWLLPRLAGLVRNRRQRAGQTSAVNVTRGIYGTALLFAAFHSSVWPTPIPLFLLALGLGYLTYRTQSLVGPLVMHALFNAVPCLLILL